LYLVEKLSHEASASFDAVPDLVCHSFVEVLGKVGVEDQKHELLDCVV